VKFIADRNELAQAVANAAQGVPGVLRADTAGVRVKAAGKKITFSCGDADTVFTSVLPSGGSGRDGEAVLPGIFPAITRSLPDEEVTVDTTGGKAEVRCGKTSFVLPLLPASPLQQRDITSIAFMDGHDFRTALRQVLPAVSKDNPNPALSGIRLELADRIFRLAATDGYMLAAADCPAEPSGPSGPGSGPVLLPGRAAERIARLPGDQTSVGWDSGRIQLTMDDTTVTCRQIDISTFPKGWDRVLAGRDWNAELDAASLLASVRAAMLTAQTVSFAFGDELTVSATGMAGMFSQVFPVKASGDPVVLRLGAGYLSAVLANTLRPKIAFTTAMAPVTFGDSGVRYMIQPRRDI